MNAVQSLAKLGDASGLPAATAALESNDSGVRGAAAEAVGMIGDAQTGLPALDKAFALEADPNTRGIIDFARGQLRARLHLQPAAAAAPAAPTPAASPAPADAAKAGKGRRKKKARAKKKPAAASQTIPQPAPPQ
jgi:HEAT repeat protein